MRALAKNPASRYQNATECRAVLEAALGLSTSRAAAVVRGGGATTVASFGAAPPIPVGATPQPESITVLAVPSVPPRDPGRPPTPTADETVAFAFHQEPAAGVSGSSHPPSPVDTGHAKTANVPLAASLILVLLAAGGGGAYFWLQNQKSSEAKAQAAVADTAAQAAPSGAPSGATAGAAAQTEVQAAPLVAGGAPETAATPPPPPSPASTPVQASTPAPPSAQAAAAKPAAGTTRVPSQTPPAPAPSQVAQPPARVAGPAPAAAGAPVVSLPDVAFRKVKLVTQDGTSERTTDVVLMFVGDRLSVVPAAGGAAIRSVRCREVISASYAKGQKKRLGFIKSSQHLLTIEAGAEPFLLRLDKDNVGAVLEALEARSGKAVSR
jgi:hypothetical protein